MPELPEATDPPILVLCDWAEAINNKLYIQGAGFNRILADTPMPLAIAILWNIPWHLTNTKLELVIQLMTDDGKAVSDPAGNPIRIDGAIEAGRAAGSKHGDSFPVPLAIKLPPFPFPLGDYRWEVTIAGQYSARASFRAVSNLGV